jgi:hypothetical protein
MGNKELGIEDVSFSCGHTREVASYIAAAYRKDKRGFCFKCFDYKELK